MIQLLDIMYQKGFASVAIFVLAVSATTIAIVVLHRFSSSDRTTGVEDVSRSSIPVELAEKPSPQLKSDYTTSGLDSEWDILVSEDFGISINIPKGSSINKGGGFDPSNPEKETVQLGLNIPQNMANAVVAINTGKKVSKSVAQVAQEVTEQIGPAGFNYTKPIKKTVNNAIGYETYASNDSGTIAYHFITEKDDRYIDVWYYYPWNGIERTGNEQKIVEEIIVSFKLLE